MKWYVLYTRHHHEQAVYERLRQKSFEAYLPLAPVWRQTRKGLRQALRLLFPRRIFVRCHLDMYTHLELITIPGAICLLEDAREQFVVIPEAEIQTLQQLCGAGIHLERAAYQRQGEYAQVIQGPLRGITGIVREGSRMTLLVPIHALKESVAVDISQAEVIQCSGGETREPA